MNMKAKIATLIIVVCLCAGFGTYLLKQKGINPIDGLSSAIKSDFKYSSPENFFPKNTSFLMSISNLEESWDEIKKTRFWKNLTSLKLWNETGFNKKLEKFKSDFKKETGFKLSKEKIFSLIGKNVSFGIVSKKDSGNASFIIQANVSKFAKFIENTIKGQLKEGNDIHKTEYKGEEITSILLKKGGDYLYISYSLINNILNISFSKKGEHQIKEIIDISKGETAKSLAENPVFTETKNRFNESNKYKIFLFANTELLLSQIESYKKIISTTNPTTLNKISKSNIEEKLKMLKSIYLKTFRTPEGLEVKAISLFNVKSMSEDEKRQYLNKKHKITSINLIPKDTLSYSINTSINILELWREVKKQFKDLPKNSNTNSPNFSKIQEFEKKYSVDIEEDFLRQINSEIAFVFHSFDLSSPFFPIPRFGLILNVLDPNILAYNLKTLINKLILNSKIPVPINFEAKEVDEEKIYVAKTPLGDALSPVLGAYKSWFLFTTSIDMYKNFTETSSKKREDIRKNLKYNNIFSQSTNLNTTKIYESFTDIINFNLNLQKILKTTMNTSPLAIAAPPKIIDTIKNSVLPILNCLEVFDSAGTYANMKEGTNMYSYTTKIIFSDLKEPTTTLPLETY